jgi:hypothetical protein
MHLALVAMVKFNLPRSTVREPNSSSLIRGPYPAVQTPFAAFCSRANAGGPQHRLVDRRTARRHCHGCHSHAVLGVVEFADHPLRQPAMTAY